MGLGFLSNIQQQSTLTPLRQVKRGISATSGSGGGGGANQFTIANSQNFSIADNTVLSGGKVELYFAGWVNFDAVNVQQTVFIKGDAITVAGCEYALWLLSTGVLRFTMSDGTSTLSASTAAITANTWYFVEAYYDSSNNRCRINLNRGTPASGVQSTGTQDTAKPFTFGSDGVIDYLGGRLFGWGFWKNTLAATVTGYMDFLYNGGLGRTYADLTTTQKTGLVAWWDFGESTGNLLDKQGANNMTPSASRPTVGASALNPGGAGSVTITTPVTNQVVQRKVGTMFGDIKITGTYSGAPTDIEAQYNGGVWKAINATGAGGLYTGVLTNQGVSTNGTLNVRFANNTAVTGTKTFGGLGIVIAALGQSNMSGRGTNNQTFTQGMAPAYLFGNDYVWKTLADPYDSSTSQVDAVSNDSGAGAGSIWPIICTALSASNAIPIAIIPCPKGGSSIAQWQAQTDHFSRTTLYGSAAYRINLIGAEFIAWFQGETDMVNGQTQAYYQLNFENMATNYMNDTGLKIMPCKVHTLGVAAGVSSGAQAQINNAIGVEWSSNPNVILGPDLTGITADSTDGLHLNSDANLLAAANLWITKIKTYCGLS